MCSTGKVAGDGRPPAKEMISGRIVTLRISRMAELCSFCARSENCQVIGEGFSIFMLVSLNVCGLATFVGPACGSPGNRRHWVNAARIFAALLLDFGDQLDLD